MSKTLPDWNPETYTRFRGLRLRPAIDLLAQVPDLPPGGVVDLGCGNGAVAEALSTRLPDRPLAGIDNSPAMLEKARETGRYHTLTEADVAAWSPRTPPALMFSNAALHWLPDHGTLMPRLAAMLAPGGTLAVQMPRQQMAPAHRLLREIAARDFPNLFDFTHWQPQVSNPAFYAEALAGLGRLSLWQTEYHQRLDPQPQGHPVRHFSASTAMRPFLKKLDDQQAASFTAACDAALEPAYPRQPDGSVIYPFRRLFFVLTT